MEKYQDRKEAGQILAEQLANYKNRNDVVVLGLARGGVPVAYEVAQALNAPLDVFIVRKLGVPGHEELAMGALASGGATVFNEDIVNELRITPSAIEQVIAEEQQELQRREKKYRGNRPFPKIKDQVVIIVDDGIATGATMRVAIKALRLHHPASIIVAVPVAEAATCNAMAKIADRVVCPLKPHDFFAVGVWYDQFNQTTDEEVRELLGNSFNV